MEDVNSTSKGTGMAVEEGVKGLEEPELVDDDREMVLSGHSSTAPCMNSPWL